MGDQAAYIPRLFLYYKDTIRSQMKEECKYKNDMEIPKITKIVFSMSSKIIAANQKLVDKAVDEVFLITGQKPRVSSAKKSIAGFKLREGMKLGCSSTLRRSRMYEFLDRLINISLPSVRDFRGISKNSFDGNGNLSIGIQEQTIFPEISYDKVDNTMGANITIVTTAKTDEEGMKLLLKFGFPIK